MSVWDVENGAVSKVLEGRECGIYSVAWSPDGQVIACAFGDSTIGVWDIGKERLLKVLEG
ncbi:WD40 repeat domain-containing protein, partial [Candidatus Saccharibacteria bacterium]|nr:WD40 repeat domain-containing protein [Candidatus Saccharibacteria bacterium]